MANISNITTKELTRFLAASDFELMEFVPNNLSAEENDQALNTMSEYSNLYMQSIGDFLDLYKDKRATQEQIDITTKKVTPGCITNILVLFGSFLIGALANAIIYGIVIGIIFGILALCSVELTEKSIEPWFAVIMVPYFILFFVWWFFVAKKIRKFTISKEELAKLASLKEHLSTVQTQLDGVIKHLGYAKDANEDTICDEICTVVDNYSKVADLLKKRDVILKDPTLSPSACLLAIEQVYNMLRQEKHNKAMEEATYNAADRIAGEVARQEETNRMVGAFLAGLMNGRND